jgi:hypothetical protein
MPGYSLTVVASNVREETSYMSIIWSLFGTRGKQKRSHSAREGFLRTSNQLGFKIIRSKVAYVYRKRDMKES